MGLEIKQTDARSPQDVKLRGPIQLDRYDEAFWEGFCVDNVTESGGVWIYGMGPTSRRALMKIAASLSDRGLEVDVYGPPGDEVRTDLIARDPQLPRRCFSTWDPPAWGEVNQKRYTKFAAETIGMDPTHPRLQDNPIELR